MTTEKATWKGASGRTYTYWVHSLNTNWKAVPGNYIFAKRSGHGWIAIYIGETDNLAERLPNHEKWDCARRHGVTHLHAHENTGGAAARRAEEADLIENYDPPCNKQ